jgi:hypothetical protein
MRSVCVAIALAAAATVMAGVKLHGADGPVAKNASLPRTLDGHPDMQGTWVNGTLTPFERPAGFENKPYLTEAEAADVERRAAERAANPPPPRPGDGLGDNEAFVDGGYKVTVTRQASLVMDPPDGQIPFRPEVADKRRFNQTDMTDFETMSQWDRCISRSPTLMVGAGYNNGYQIVQAGSNVVVLAEMVHEARVIPTDGHPHPDGRVRFWTGDPRGHWEGDTLVVDSTNFRDGGWLSTQSASGRLRGTPLTSHLHLVERFTLRNANTLVYEATIEDASLFTRPFTVMVPFTRDDSYQIYEYACHEGNKAIEDFLRGARADERRK